MTLKELTLSIPSIILAIVFFIVIFSKENSSKYILIKKFIFPIILTAFFVNSLFYAFLLPYFSPIDEGAHFAYIQHIAEKNKLPTINNHVSREVISISENIYPEKTASKARDIGLAGYSYEAFQPPLYYISSLPFYWLGGSNFIHKIFLIRIWGIIQLLILIFLSYKIFKNIKSNFFTKKPELLLLIFLLLIGLTPAMIVRAVTIGNSIMPIIFVTASFYYITKKLGRDQEITKKKSLIFGILSGAALLSKITVLFIIPIIILFLLIKKGSFVKNIAIYIITILIIIMPWFIFNKITYGTITANKQAQELHSMVVNPKHENIFNNWNYIKISFYPTFLNGIWIPEETVNFIPWKQYDPIAIANYLNIIWIIGACVFSYFIFTKFYLKKKRVLFLTFSLIPAIVSIEIFQQVIGTLANNWPMMHGRYFHSVIIFASFFSIIPFLLFENKKYFIIKEILTIVSFLLLIFLNISYINSIAQTKKLYLKEIPLGTDINKNIWNEAKNLFNIDKQFSSNIAHANTNDPQILIRIDKKLNGLTFNTSATGKTQLYYLFEGENGYQELFSDTTKEKMIILNIKKLDQIWGKNLIEIRIDPTDKKESFEISNFKIYE